MKRSLDKKEGNSTVSDASDSIVREDAVFMVVGPVMSLLNKSGR